MAETSKAERRLTALVLILGAAVVLAGAGAAVDQLGLRATILIGGGLFLVFLARGRADDVIVDGASPADSSRAVRVLTALFLVAGAATVLAAVVVAIELSLSHFGTRTTILIGVGLLFVVGSMGERWGSDGRRWSMSDDAFEDLVRSVEEDGHRSLTPTAMIGTFQAAVRDAIDELPAFVQAELERNVAVIVEDDGQAPERYGVADGDELYGLYVGSTAAGEGEGARILLFRDTLERDFDDPAELRRQIQTTLRHEIAHHFGADEDRVRLLGL